MEACRWVMLGISLIALIGVLIPILPDLLFMLLGPFVGIYELFCPISEDAERLNTAHVDLCLHIMKDLHDPRCIIRLKDGECKEVSTSAIVFSGTHVLKHRKAALTVKRHKTSLTIIIWLKCEERGNIYTLEYPSDQYDECIQQARKWLTHTTYDVFP